MILIININFTRIFKEELLRFLNDSQIKSVEITAKTFEFGYNISYLEESQIDKFVASY